MSAAAANDPPHPGRTIVWATVASTITVFLLTGSLVWAVSGELGNAVAIGAFCAFWGGLGFGVMAGGAANAVAEERRRLAEKEASVVQRVSDDPEQTAA